MPRFGGVALDEQELKAELANFRNAVELWAKRHELWHDADFHVPFIHRNERPTPQEVLVLTYEGPLYRLFNGECDFGVAEREFYNLVETHGLWCEPDDYTTMSFGFIDTARATKHLRLQRWEWIKQLMKERLDGVRSEVFEHFADCPEDLKRLDWRKFEEILDAIFRNQGFGTQLGPGGNDGGVDVRLYQNGALPELVALVQAKRYRSRPISQGPIAELFGIAALEGVQNAVFVTSSRFQPKARAFALATERKVGLPTISLADGERVAEWCRTISDDLTKYFTDGMVPPLHATATELTGRIVIARHGVNMILNSFCVIEADFAREAVLRPIGREIVSGDLQVGSEIPSMAASANHFCNDRFTAFKSQSPEGEFRFWGNRRSYSLWDGIPVPFDTLD